MVLDLPQDVEAALMFQARAARMPTERYLARILEHAVESHRRLAAEQLIRHLDVMGAQVAPDTTAEQMESALEDALSAIRPLRTW